MSCRCWIRRCTAKKFSAKLEVLNSNPGTSRIYLKGATLGDGKVHNVHSISSWFAGSAEATDIVSEVRFEYPHISNVGISLSPLERFLNLVIGLRRQNMEMTFVGYGAAHFFFVSRLQMLAMAPYLCGGFW